MAKYKIKWYNGTKYFWTGKKWMRSKFQQRKFSNSNSTYKKPKMGYFWIDSTGACRQTDYQGYLEAKQAKLRTCQRYLKDDEDLLL